MSIIIFLIILSILVIVHELGHFGLAKKFGIRVDEFGLGYPPKAKKLFSWKGTDFTLNWLPFGGFVKIFGENPTEQIDHSDLEVRQPSEVNVEARLPQSELSQKSSDSFQNKNRGIQAAVLVAGVVMNFLFAWLLISLGFVSGLPAPAGTFPVENAVTTVTTVIPGSPASEAGLKSGDQILAVSREGEIVSDLSPEIVSAFIGRATTPLTFSIQRGEESKEIVVTPADGIVAGKPAVGISMDEIGITKLPIHKAFYYGFITTVDLTIATAQALGSFILNAVFGKADLSQVTGPVGIVGMVGDVRALGFAYLLSFTAIISINLAIVNLLPFPALDGGRLVFVIIETIIRRPVSPKVFNIANTIGFAVLIILMVIITARDITNLF